MGDGIKLQWRLLQASIDRDGALRSDMRTYLTSVEHFLVKERHAVKLSRCQFICFAVTGITGAAVGSSGEWDRRAVLTQDADTGLERTWMVERGKLHSLYALVFLDAEVIHGGFKRARVTEATQLLQVPRTASHNGVAVSQLAIIHNRGALDRVISPMAVGSNIHGLTGVLPAEIYLVLASAFALRVYVSILEGVARKVLVIVL